MTVEQTVQSMSAVAARGECSGREVLRQTGSIQKCLESTANNFLQWYPYKVQHNQEPKPTLILTEILRIWRHRHSKELTAVMLGLGLNPREGMDVCKCIVPSQHGGTLNSHRAASPLMRLEEGEERWVAPDHPQGVLPQN
ncbi:uncharacterized protein TNCV_2464561 [Trichonephila clavipes]|nr:uncharacterized protein TNCV_2464561 [Trichonephila clavipes]